MNEIVYDLSLTDSVQSRACDRCRLQKLKCDRRDSCSNCQRRRLECLYTAASSARKRRRKSVGTDDDQLSFNQVLIPASLQSDTSLVTGSPTSEHTRTAVAADQVTSELSTWTGNQTIDFFDYSDFWQSCLGHDSFDFNFETSHSPSILWQPSINVDLVKRLIRLYIAHIVPSMPVCLPKPLINGIDSQRYQHDRAFAAYLLALCAFVSLQAPPPSRSVNLGRQFLTEATRLYNNEHLGENPAVETVLACFHIFGSLWTLGSENAAWLKLQETINLMRLVNIRETDLMITQSQDWQSKINLYLGLIVVERAFAAGREHLLALPMPSLSLLELYRKTSQSLDSGDARNANAMCLLVQSFGQLNNDIMICWRNKCERSRNGLCTNLSAHKMNTILASFPTSRSIDWQRLLMPNEEQNANDAGDVLLTCLWLQNRLWRLALTHDLLAAGAPSKYLRFDFAIHLAQEALSTCKAFRISSFEGHGQGLAEKLYNIACDFLEVAQWLRQPDTPRTVTLKTVPPGPPVLQETMTTDTPASILSGTGENEAMKEGQQASYFDLARGLLGFLAILDNDQNNNFTQFLERYQKYTFAQTLH